MYNVDYLEVTPGGYINKSFTYDSFVVAINVYKNLIAQPFIDAVIYRAGNPKSMSYVNKIIPF